MQEWREFFVDTLNETVVTRVVKLPFALDQDFNDQEAYDAVMSQVESSL